MAGSSITLGVLKKTVGYLLFLQSFVLKLIIYRAGLKPPGLYFFSKGRISSALAAV